MSKNSTWVAGAGLENKSTIGSEETKNGLLTDAFVPLTGLLTFAWKKQSYKINIKKNYFKSSHSILKIIVLLYIDLKQLLLQPILLVSMIPRIHLLAAQLFQKSC